MALRSRRDVVHLSIAGLFVTNAVLAELIGGKLIQIGPFPMSIGVIPWPIVFILTDIMNEYFGPKGVRRLSLMTAGLILYTFLVLYAAMGIPAASFSPVQDGPFRIVFGQSLWIIAGSLTAFLVGQLVDVLVFWALRHRTGPRLLWLRATGSTVVSQLIDTLIVQGIAFWLPGKLSTSDFLKVAGISYTYKLAIAVGITPLLYLAHALIDRFLGREESEALIESAGQGSPLP